MIPGMYCGGARLEIRPQDAERVAVLMHLLDECAVNSSIVSPFSAARLMILSSMSVMLRT